MTATTEVEDGGDPARQRGSKACGVVAVIVVGDEWGSWTKADGGRSPVATRTARPQRRLRLGRRGVAGPGERGERRSQEGEWVDESRGIEALRRWRPYPPPGVAGEAVGRERRL